MATGIPCPADRHDRIALTPKELKGSPIKSLSLISTPWPLFNRPSIQLAVLKAYLHARHPRLRVVAHHFYLKVAESIGYRIYQEISERTWLAEPIYAALLYPERQDQIEKIFSTHVKPGTALASVNFHALTQQVAETTNRFIERTDWHQFGLIGFSICLCQFTATLFFLKRIKTLCPQVPVVVGGSMFSGGALIKLIKVVPQIDFAVNGEGELPLDGLVTHLMNSRTRHEEPVAIPGLVSAQSGEENDPVTRNQIRNLDDLPIPDFEDYFNLLQSLDSKSTFFPTLPAEISRGCWWQRTAPGKAYSGCAFCNLNLQWKGYRTKKTGRVVTEIENLTSTYRTLSVAFVDNLLPLKESEKIFERLSRSKKDYRLFGEIRAATSRQQLVKMKMAGVSELQIGIEALSSRLLGKLHKGTTAIQNLEVMKNCEELGLDNASNLITQFPGSDSQDVEETLRNLEFAFAYRPIRAVPFWLGLGSPVWNDPQRFGIQAVFNHPNWSRLLAEEGFKQVDFSLKAYRGDRTRQKELWRPVTARVKTWEQTYARMLAKPQAAPILSYRDGKTFLTIRQRRDQADTITHRLVGPSRDIYLYCRRTRRLKNILGRFPQFDEERMCAFLKMMVAKKLMFEENNKYLSLAVSRRPGAVFYD